MSEWKEDAVELSSTGMSWRNIAKVLEVPRSTVSDYLRKVVSVDAPVEVQAVQEAEETFSEEILDDLCESPDYDTASLAKRLRNVQRTNNQLRKVHRQSIDSTDHFGDMVKAVEEATNRINTQEVYRFQGYNGTGQDRPEGVMEILFSDFQIGKKGQHYNSEIALESIKRYGEQLQGLIIDKSYDYKITKIVFASLGDIVEDHMKHGIQSATSTDSGLAEQMARAIDYIWTYVLRPLASIGIPMEVICIAGNHGSSQHKGMDMYKAGLYSYDYVIYKALQGYARNSGFSHVEFNIPEGVFGHTQIFGRHVVYEHGYFNTATEKSMNDQMQKRGQQIKKHVDYFRCGDMHHLCSFDNHKLVLNGAFFGIDDEGIEYSGILGFNSIPTQAVMFHVDEKVLGRNSIKELISIQVCV